LEGNTEESKGEQKKEPKIKLSAYTFTSHVESIREEEDEDGSNKSAAEYTKKHKELTEKDSLDKATDAKKDRLIIELADEKRKLLERLNALEGKDPGDQNILKKEVSVQREQPKAPEMS